MTFRDYCSKTKTKFKHNFNIFNSVSVSSFSNKKKLWTLQMGRIDFVTFARLWLPITQPLFVSVNYKRAGKSQTCPWINDTEKKNKLHCAQSTSNTRLLGNARAVPTCQGQSNQRRKDTSVLQLIWGCVPQIRSHLFIVGSSLPLWPANWVKSIPRKLSHQV